MSPNIAPVVARALAGQLDLLLAQPRLDADTERRARWLRLRLGEALGERAFDLIEARIALACPAEGARRAAG